MPRHLMSAWKCDLGDSSFNDVTPLQNILMSRLISFRLTKFNCCSGRAVTLDTRVMETMHSVDTSSTLLDTFLFVPPTH